jgi:hypothetical protein
VATSLSRSAVHRLCKRFSCAIRWATGLTACTNGRICKPCARLESEIGGSGTPRAGGPRRSRVQDTPYAVRFPERAPSRISNLHAERRDRVLRGKHDELAPHQTKVSSSADEYLGRSRAMLRALTFVPCVFVEVAWRRICRGRIARALAAGVRLAYGANVSPVRSSTSRTICVRFMTMPKRPACRMSLRSSTSLTTLENGSARAGGPTTSMWAP